MQHLAPHTAPLTAPDAEPRATAPHDFEPRTTTPHISVRFPVHGRTLPADHGYALHAAVTRALPALHSALWFALELISGIPRGEGIIALPARAALNLRLPAHAYAEVLPLAGRRLDIAGHKVTLGIPAARPLTPAASLYARHVTIKNFTEPDTFLDAAQRQLAALGINATLELPRDEHDRARRRVLTIKGARIVGFSLAVHDLSDDDSILLQTHGIGGRRAFGCGIFNPIASTRMKEQQV